MLLAGCTCAIALSAQTTSGWQSRLDSQIASTLAAFEAAGVSVAVVQNGSLVYAKGFGDANIAARMPAGTDTRYAVGSISKQFTAAALLLEQERGKLSLDDKVAKYFPNLTRATEISIRQLLSHTSGYEDYAPQDYLIPEWTKPTTPDAILDRWAKKPLNFDPGTRWQYSNTNYVLAGKILEKVSGQSLLPFLKENFFDPLKMTSAGDCAVKQSTDATAYTRYALGPPRPVGREGNGWYFAAGELCMTPSDLGRWDIAFLRKQILSQKSYEEFTREVKLNDGKSTHYALGLQTGEMAGSRLLTHSGEVSGFLSMNTVFPEKSLGVAVLSNEDGMDLISAVTRETVTLLLQPPNAETERRDAAVRNILEGLQAGQIDREVFTANANSYFNETALNDYRTSLLPLGKLRMLNRQSESLRGGMAHLGYRARFEHDTVRLNIYVTPDGKFEQFLVEEY
jgi:CubicO group peptidase (beta-lactamase class C family)